MQALYPASDADDALFTGGLITREISVVLLPVGRRHQHLHVLANHVVCTAAKHAFGSGIKDEDLRPGSMTRCSAVLLGRP